MPCRRRMWVWRHVSRLTYKGHQSEAPASRAAPTVREMKHGWTICICPLGLDSYSNVFFILFLSLYICTFDLYLTPFCSLSRSTFHYSNSTIHQNFIPETCIYHQSSHIFIQSTISSWYRYVSLGYISCTLSTGLGRNVDLFFFTLHERWLACPLGCVAERQRRAWGIIPLEGFQPGIVHPVASPCWICFALGSQGHRLKAARVWHTITE